MDELMTVSTKGAKEFLDVTKIVFNLDMENGIDIELYYLDGTGVEEKRFFHYREGNANFYLIGELGAGKIFLDVESELTLLARLRTRLKWIKKSTRIF